MPTIDPATVTNAQELERFAELACLELVDLIDGARRPRAAVPFARALVVALEFAEPVADGTAQECTRCALIIAGAIADALAELDR